MKKTATMALVLFACVSFAQTRDTTQTIKIEPQPVKVSLMSNYYDQDGERGAVNGGVGSQELISYSQEGSIYIPVKSNVALKLNGGVDYFTAASYLDIDKYKTSASNGSSGVSVDETRYYGGVGVDITNENKSKTYSPYAGFSTEYDVNSVNFGYGQTWANKEKGTAFTTKGGATLDQWMLIYPGEFRGTVDGISGASDKGSKILASSELKPITGETITKDGKTYGSDNRATYALSNAYSFVINQKMNALIGLDMTLQNGLLSTPFYRVYFHDGVTDEFTKAVKVEKLPDSRFKASLYGRFNWFTNSFLVLRTNGRIYSDSWGINALTLGLEAPIKLHPSVSLAPFYRFHVQSKAKYFAGYGHHELTDEYYTSDFDLANFYSNKVGGSLRFVPFNKLGFGEHFKVKSLDLRYSKYFREDGLTAQSVTVELNFDL